MNYTENYHLPQWEKTDRVLMEDFNDAMNSLETGLTACHSMAEAGGSDAKNALNAGLYRMAYNHWHAVAAPDAFAGQAGVFRQGFAEGEGGNAPGMVQMEDGMWMVNGDARLTINNMLSSITSTEISSDNGKDNMTINFTPSYSGRLTGIQLLAYFNVSGGSNSGLYTLSLYERGQLVAESSGDMGLTTLGSTYVTLPANIQLHAKYSYQVKLQMTKLDFYANIKLEKNASCMTVTGYQIPSSAISCPLSFAETSQKGLFLVHYDSLGEGGSLSLTWDGEEMTPLAIRTITNERGKTVKEAEFRLTREIPANSNAQLKLECNKGGEIVLYDWGAILL